MRFFSVFLILSYFFISAPAYTAVHTPEQFVLKTQSDNALTTTSTQVLAENLARAYLIIQNKGSVSIIMHLVTLHASEGVEIPAGGNYEPMRVPTSAIFLKASSGTSTAAIIEGNL